MRYPLPAERLKMLRDKGFTDDEIEKFFPGFTTESRPFEMPYVGRLETSPAVGYPYKKEDMWEETQDRYDGMKAAYERNAGRELVAGRRKIINGRLVRVK